MNIFESAVRMKLRFNHKGFCSAEDLWDLSLGELDSIFKDLNSKVKQHSEESLLGAKDKQQDTLNLKIEIIRYVVKTKLAEKEERENSHLEASRKQKILGILEQKKEQELHDMTAEELEKLL